MNGSAADVIVAVVVPLSVASVIAAVGTRWSASRRFAIPAAFAVAMLAGCWFMPTPWIPTRHWHWLPYVTVLAALVGLATSDDHDHPPITTLLLLALLAGIAAWCLIPTWASLQPPRRFLLPGLAIYLFSLMYSLQRMPTRATDRTLLALMVGSSLAVAVCGAALVSISYAKLAMIATTALIGAGWIAWRSESVPAIRALFPAYAIVVGGCALFCAIEPSPPLLSLGIIPWVPVLATILTAPRSVGAGTLSQRLRWLVAIAILGITTFMLFRSAQSPPSNPEPTIEEDALILDEEYFQ